MMFGKFLAGPWGSFLRVSAAAALTAWLLDLNGAVTVDFGAWQVYVVAGLVSALPVLIAYLNPADARFGRGAAADA